MVTVISIHLLPALIAGLLVYELVHVLAPFFPDTSRAPAPGVWPSAWWCWSYSAR
jgi:hypothetical protein